MKFYKRDPDRALAGMAELTMKQRGVYNSLLDLLYSRDGVVPDDDRRVAKMIACHWREYETVKAELLALGKIWHEGGYLRAKRVQETIKSAADFAQDQRKRASNGWQKKRLDNEIKDAPLPGGNACARVIDTATATDTEERKISGRATRWPPDKQIPDDWLQKGEAARRRHRLPPIDLRLEAERFKNYWASKSGANGTKLDWEKTWVNWALRAEETKNGSRSRQSANARFLEGAKTFIDGLERSEESEGNCVDADPIGRPLLPP